MKKIIRKALNDSRITDLIGDNSFLMVKPENVRCDSFVIYHILNHKFQSYSGDNGKIEEYLIQFSIYSKSNFEDIVENLNEVLRENGFLFQYDLESYEDETKYYAYIARYKYYK